MENKISLEETLILIQSELKAPKGQYNNFGKYKYRSTEDILEAVKPLLKKHSLSMTISDTTEELCGIPVVNAIVSVFNTEDTISVQAQAGVDINKKGMDVSQTFGAASSYARKYALNGMFLIDDSKDADSQDNRGEGEKKTFATSEQVEAMVKAINAGKSDAVEKALEKYSNITMDKLVLMARITK